MNRFLLIDFGASYVKSILYNKELNFFENLVTEKSPLYNKTKLAKSVVLHKVKSILKQYDKVDAVVMCSVLGGYYDNDIYYSWKNENSQKVPKDSCLLSELFREQKTYHIHNNHNPISSVTGLQVLGYLDGIKFYSSLGDTYCVIESVNLKENELLINLGTGSQIIKKNENYEITAFIPSGRALNTFYTFFKSMDVDIFDKFNLLSIDDLEKATLDFDLNIFPQSYKFAGGGSIDNIFEDTFNIDNFISSLFKSYIFQYIEIILSYEGISNLYLTGGISKKYKLITDYISQETGIEAQVSSAAREDTHIGMGNIIRKYL